MLAGVRGQITLIGDVEPECIHHIQDGDVLNVSNVSNRLPSL